MYAVIFEVEIKPSGKDEYLSIAAELKNQLKKVDGFISIERFQSLINKEKLLSLSFWESEESIKNWKANFDHLRAQSKGRESLFKDYHIRVVEVQRDYTMQNSEFNNETDKH